VLIAELSLGTGLCLVSNGGLEPPLPFRRNMNITPTKKSVVTPLVDFSLLNIFSSYTIIELLPFYYCKYDIELAELTKDTK
jgi:hypothetical protein